MNNVGKQQYINGSPRKKRSLGAGGDVLTPDGVVDVGGVLDPLVRGPAWEREGRRAQGRNHPRDKKQFG